MNFIARLVSGGTLAAALVALPTLAMAQDTNDKPATKPTEPAPPAAPLPPPRSHDQTPPPPPQPKVESLRNGIKITKEAGIGGTQSYARAGVVELGGSVGFSLAGSFSQLNISPSVGYFLADNFELSAIASLSYVNTDSRDSTLFTAVIEPSYHIPFSSYLFGFAGIGAGLTTSNRGTGLALAPRVGMNVMVGRSGILTPALLLSYSTAESLALAGSSGSHVAFGANVGYTVMW